MKGDAELQGAWDFASAGTYTDARLPRAAMCAFLVAAFAVIALPAIGVFWARTDFTTENRELAEPPVLFGEDGAFNWDVLADAGSYFEDHFAYRNQIVTANARLRAPVFASPTDQVVVGSDSWLYYGGTLPDYLGQSELSERALRNIAHNLLQAQSYAQAHGATFVFALAPNKNSLYAEHMPYYYMQAPGPSNAEVLKPILQEYGVNYVDLFELFEGMEGRWYLLRDTHWDNRGALMATQALLDSVGHACVDLDVESGTPRDDFVGDLESMLYPAGARSEENWYFDGYNSDPDMSGERWSYLEGGEVDDAFVRTQSVEGEGNAVMFRDSFGNALLPYWASAYENATFSKLVPYNLPLIVQEGANAVVIERAERHLSYLAENPPIMPAPVSALSGDWPMAEDSEGVSTSLELTRDGRYWKLVGALADGCASPTTEIYLVAIPKSGKAVTITPAWVSVTDESGTLSDYGFQAYLAQGGIDLQGAMVRVYAVTDGDARCLRKFDDIQPSE